MEEIETLSAEIVQYHLQIAAKADPKAITTFRTLLIDRINFLLDKDFERLLEALYRIDVNEKKVKTLLSGKSPIAGELADLIISRQAEKALTRLQHKKKHPEF